MAAWTQPGDMNQFYHKLWVSFLLSPSFCVSAPDFSGNDSTPSSSIQAQIIQSIQPVRPQPCLPDRRESSSCVTLSLYIVICDILILYPAHPGVGRRKLQHTPHSIPHSLSNGLLASSAAQRSVRACRPTCNDPTANQRVVAMPVNVVSAGRVASWTLDGLVVKLNGSDFISPF